MPPTAQALSNPDLDQSCSLTAHGETQQAVGLTPSGASTARIRLVNSAASPSFWCRRYSGEAQKRWSVPEDLIMDLDAPPGGEVFESYLPQIDFCQDVKMTGSESGVLSNWGDASEQREVDLCLDDCALDDRIPGLLRFGPVGWHNLTDEFDWGRLHTNVELDDVQTGWKPLRLFRESRSSRLSGFLTSGLIHAAVFILFFIHPVSQISGSSCPSGNVVSVTIAAEEDLVPQDECPASVDSAASMPSTKKQTKQEEKPLEDKKTAREEPVKEEGPQDSTASLPSTASAERRFIAAAGQEGKTFESMVLSAIRESIFYPKKAVNDRHYGEVVVAFVLNEDGSLSSLSITKPSGSPLLDEAALKIIQKAAKKFPPIPAALHRHSVDYVVPILFKEKRG